MSEHDFDPVHEGCRRCGALPGDGESCVPPDVSLDEFQERLDARFAQIEAREVHDPDDMPFLLKYVRRLRAQVAFLTAARDRLLADCKGLGRIATELIALTEKLLSQRDEAERRLWHAETLARDAAVKDDR